MIRKKREEVDRSGWRLSQLPRRRWPFLLSDTEGGGMLIICNVTRQERSDDSTAITWISTRTENSMILCAGIFFFFNSSLQCLQVQGEDLFFFKLQDTLSRLLSVIVEDTGVPNKVATAIGGCKDLQNRPSFFHVFLGDTHHRRPVCGPGCLQKVVQAQPPCEKKLWQSFFLQLFSTWKQRPYTRRDSNVVVSAAFLFLTSHIPRQFAAGCKAKGIPRRCSAAGEGH